MGQLAMASRPGRFLAVSALSLGIALAGTGCASVQTHSAAVVSAAPTYRSAEYTGDLTAPIVLAGTGITLAPPVQATAPLAIDWSQAFQTCTTGDALCDPSLTPNVYLAVATKPDSGMIGQLVWVIDYSGSKCVPYGHTPALSSSMAPAPLPARAYACRLVNLIDSATGKVLWSVRVPQ